MLVLKNFISNKEVESSTSEFHNIFDPGKGEILAKVPLSTKEEVKEIIDSSKEAFEKWRETPFAQRLKIVWKLREAIEKYEDELAYAIAINVGKTIKEARGEILRAKENIEASISFIQKVGVRVREIYREIDEEVYREPIGVFVCISAFNFPFMIPFWYVPYALILGNTIILKPSELTPYCYTVVTKILKEALPPGIVNVIHGAKEVVNELIGNEKISGVAFVGSTPVGKIIYDLASKYRKRVIVQAGAKNRILVMPDANLEKSIQGIIHSFYGMAGQRCLAGSILLTLEENYEKVMSAFIKATQQIRVGYMLDEVDMGPVVSKKSKERIINLINEAEQQGAKITLDGRKIVVKGYENGFYVGPTIIENVERDMRIYEEEIFGPVVVALKAKNFDEAMEIFNDTKYGNAGSIFTSNGKIAREFVKRAEVGNVGINIGVAQPAPYFPFAGKKESFFGILHGQADTLDFFTDKKVIIERWF